MKGGRPKWHFVGIVEDVEDGLLDADALGVDVFLGADAGDFAGVDVSRLLVTGCNFC